MNKELQNEKDLIQFLKNDDYRMNILNAVNSIHKKELWVAGGFIRNLVWDKLHNYTYRTELGDIDVFYFDSEELSKEKELEIENNLTHLVHNVNWSVKNQARMHLHDDNKPYINLTDAISKFPETASAVCVRMDSNQNLIFLAPFGFNDLFELKIVPTPNCKQNKKTYDKYLKRQLQKKWQIIWPLLTVEI